MKYLLLLPLLIGCTMNRPASYCAQICNKEVLIANERCRIAVTQCLENRKHNLIQSEDKDETLW